jgi:soluble lytic murein transglycosylase-like protein
MALMDAMPPLPAVLMHRAAITRAAQFRFGIPAPVALLAATMHQESNGRLDVVSRTGATGPYQFMPATATWVASQLGNTAQANDPSWAIPAAAWYISYLYKAVAPAYADDCRRFGAALSAYNGGLGWHNRRRAKAGDPSDFWNSVRLVNPGITPGNQRENAEYPQRIVYDLQARYRILGGRLICISS